MGFFDKKYCDVCGEKIGLLGNRKLEDGNLCKNCAAKLPLSSLRESLLRWRRSSSSWLTGRRTGRNWPASGRHTLWVTG